MNQALRHALQRLAAGDPLGALGFVGAAPCAHSLALRGIALAQLKEHDRARRDLRRAIHALNRQGAHGDSARAAAALAEVEANARNVGRAREALSKQRRALAALRDITNVAYLDILCARLDVLTGNHVAAQGRLEAATSMLDQVPIRSRSALEVCVSLARGELAVAQRRYIDAERHFHSALSVESSLNQLLFAEIRGRLRSISEPSLRFRDSKGVRSLTLVGYEQVIASCSGLLVDETNGTIRIGGDDDRQVLLEGRHSLFRLALTLAWATPRALSAPELFEQGFGEQLTNESHRARLKVALSRLRGALGRKAVSYRAGGWYLDVPEVVVVRTSSTSERPALRLMQDGECWSASALAEAMGVSRRHALRVLNQLVGDGEVMVLGAGRATRYVYKSYWPRIAPSELLPIESIGVNLGARH